MFIKFTNVIALIVAIGAVQSYPMVESRDLVARQDPYVNYFAFKEPNFGGGILSDQGDNPTDTPDGECREMIEGDQTGEDWDNNASSLRLVNPVVCTFYT
jgi:hypothetical protein